MVQLHYPNQSLVFRTTLRTSHSFDGHVGESQEVVQRVFLVIILPP